MSRFIESLSPTQYLHFQSFSYDSYGLKEFKEAVLLSPAFRRAFEAVREAFCFPMLLPAGNGRRADAKFLLFCLTFRAFIDKNVQIWIKFGYFKRF